MTISAKIICDSVQTEVADPARLTTFVLQYPKFIHGEFLTHRAFSRNASSSRAIPLKKQIETIRENLAKPIRFSSNQKGMQGGDALSDDDQVMGEVIWEAACQSAIHHAQSLGNLGVHKQHVNRILEPYMHITVVCTATDYANFFALRHHSMAQPEIAELAKQMWKLYQTNEPAELPVGAWHLPFVDYQVGDPKKIDWEPLIKTSVARCARISYNNHDGTPTTIEDDLKLYERLLGAHPGHSSPAEHQARCTKDSNKYYGNFRNWQQYRKTLHNENITKFEGPLG